MNTYDLTTQIGQVRLLIADTPNGELTGWQPHFSDEELQVFLNLYDGVLKFAAALALESWAAAVAQTADSEHIGDYSYTKKQVANMLALAAKYREEEGTTPACDWAEIDMTTHGDVESADAVNDWAPYQPTL